MSKDKPTETTDSEAIKRKRRFVEVLAKYLVGNEVEMSIKLQMNKPEALLWAELRSTTPIVGYVKVEEATQLLSEWLGIR